MKDKQIKPLSKRIREYRTSYVMLAPFALLLALAVAALGLNVSIRRP